MLSANRNTRTFQAAAANTAPTVAIRNHSRHYIIKSHPDICAFSFFSIDGIILTLLTCWFTCSDCIRLDPNLNFPKWQLHVSLSRIYIYTRRSRRYSKCQGVSLSAQHFIRSPWQLYITLISLIVFLFCLYAASFLSFFQFSFACLSQSLYNLYFTRLTELLCNIVV